MRRYRILTTHAGSLPRPPGLLEQLLSKDAGEPHDEGGLKTDVRSAIKEVVDKQLEVGLDVVNDGELSKPSFTTYIKDRLSGFGGEGSPQEIRTQRFDLSEFPDFFELYTSGSSDSGKIRWPACDGPVSYTNLASVTDDIRNLLRAGRKADADDLFMSAVSPGTVVMQFANLFYPSEEKYLEAVATAMRKEYEAIHAANISLQLDCPDFALPIIGTPIAEYRRTLEARVEALSFAVANIPAEAMRIHVCWGGAEMPHNHDVPLEEIIDVLLKAKPAGLMVTAANGRHEHEWNIFDYVKLPEGKYLIPGVIDPTTNIIEHPEVVAQRLVRYAEVVGRENVMGGTDCGFSPRATNRPVAPSVVWAKLKSLAEGAALASSELW